MGDDRCMFSKRGDAEGVEMRATRAEHLNTAPVQIGGLAIIVLSLIARDLST
jgi:hypothetical protein